MTQPVAPTEPDADDGNSASTRSQGPRRRTGRGRLITLVATMTALGAAAGVLWAAASGPSFVAEALVDAGPGATVAASLDVSLDQSNRFVQTELLRIDVSRPLIADAVNSKLGVDQTFDISARQLGATNVISISATADAAQSAADVANIAADTYVTDWRERAVADSQRALSAVERELSSVTQQLEALGDLTTASEKAQSDALTRQYQSLSDQQAELQLEIATVGAVNRVVERASASSASNVTSVPRTALLGALVGLVLGLVAALLVHRRSTPRAPDPWT